MKKYLAIILFFSSTTVLASTGSNMPWVPVLVTIMAALTGPTAGALSAIGLFCGVGTMVLAGGELSSLIKYLVFAVIAISILVGISSFLSTLFGVNAAIY